MFDRVRERETIINQKLMENKFGHYFFGHKNWRLSQKLSSNQYFKQSAHQRPFLSLLAFAPYKCVCEFIFFFFILFCFISLDSIQQNTCLAVCVRDGWMASNRENERQRQRGREGEKKECHHFLDSKNRHIVFLQAMAFFLHRLFLAIYMMTKCDTIYAYTQI